ncbi:MAG TPA: hypothetical protein PLY45_04365 [bacterium]|nr:hypothetical protein [bacterium]
MSDNDEEDIKALFDKVSHHFEDADEGARGMFAMLVRTALSYRDSLMHSTGHALTVAETRAALDAFMETLKVHRIPENLDKRSHDLVILWLEELRNKTHH